MKTWAHYLDGLQDGRSVWADGARVQSVAAHPNFRPLLGTLGELRALHESDPALRVAGPSGERVPAWCILPKSPEDVGRMGRVSTVFAERTLGLMGRLWDTVGGYVVGLYDVRSELGQANPICGRLLESLYQRCRDDLPLISVAFVDPPFGRDRALSEQTEVLRVQRRTSEGLVVRGSKSLCTGAAYAEELMILRVGYNAETCHPDQVVGFLVKPNAPGLRILTRPPFASLRLTAALDESDACLVFDDVFIPHEQVLYDGDVELAKRCWRTIVAWDKPCFVRRMVTKFAVMRGLAGLMAAALGVDEYPVVQKTLLELARHHEVLARLVEHAERSPVPTGGSEGTLMANPTSIHLALRYALEHAPALSQSIELLGGQAFVLIPSERDIAARETGTDYEKYLHGPRITAASRAFLMNVAAELTSSRFASRQRLLDYYAVGGLQTLEPQLQSMLDPAPAVSIISRFLERSVSVRSSAS